MVDIKLEKVSPEDTIVVKFDREEIKYDELMVCVREIYENFPGNTLLVCPKSVDIEFLDNYTIQDLEEMYKIIGAAIEEKQKNLTF